MSNDEKIRRPGAGEGRGKAPVREKLLVAYLGSFAVGAAWYYGGAADTARIILSIWGSAGMILSAWMLAQPGPGRTSTAPLLRWLWPFLAFNAVSLVAYGWVNLRTIHDGTDQFLIFNLDLPSWYPSVAVRPKALLGLWLFDAFYLPSFVLVTSLTRRGSVRVLMWIVALNASTLAVFGTVQKLTHATGLFFGRVPSPQDYFFASFVYDNHWGSFCVLAAGACTGLIMRQARRLEVSEWAESPILVALVGMLAIAISVPFSGSRAGTILICLLIGIAVAEWLRTAVRRRRRANMPSAGVVTFGLVAASLGLAAIWFVAGDTISQRVEKTHQQVVQVEHHGGKINDRTRLYEDTFRMAWDRPLFGWGTNSYPYVFYLYNTSEPGADRLPHYFHDAHSDWLQSVAEHGIVGTLLLGLCGVVPLFKMPRFTRLATVPKYLFLGCGLVLAYALVEFPFGNPAVCLTWWLAFFCAIRYAVLEEKNS